MFLSNDYIYLQVVPEMTKLIDDMKTWVID